MKKLFAVLCILVFVFSGLFATNLQKIYSIDDSVFSRIQTLYRMNGKALPSSSGPWSGSELMDMLARLDTSIMSKEQLKWYEDIKAELAEDAEGSSFDFGVLVNLEANYHTNTDAAFQSRDNWIRDFNKSPSMLNLLFENHVRENFYGYFEFNLGVAMHFQNNGTVADFGANNLSSNILMLTGNDIKQMDFNAPKRAFVAAGGEGWIFQFGRDRLSWGNGTTGNMVLGNQIQYHNMVRFATWSDNFKYTFLISGFPHPQNYYDGTCVQTNGYNQGQSTYLNGISAFIAHRLEWRIADRVGIALTEGVIYMSKDNKIDLMAFSPSMLYHNNYTRALTNSILGLEVDWAITKGLNLYAQLAIDEAVLPGEPVPGNISSGNAEPGAKGILAGLTYSNIIKGGLFSVNVEGAFTDPYLYLRDGDMQSGTEPREQSKGQYGINYVVAVREMIGAGGTEYYDEQFLGYKFGGDAIVANLNASYDHGSWNASINAFGMIHGTHDRWTVWTRVNKVEGDNVSTPTTNHQTKNQKFSDSEIAARNAAMKVIVLGASGSYNFPYGFSVFGQVDGIGIFDFGNVEGSRRKDFQFTLGLRYKY